MNTLQPSSSAQHYGQWGGTYQLGAHYWVLKLINLVCRPINTHARTICHVSLHIHTDTHIHRRHADSGKSMVLVIMIMVMNVGQSQILRPVNAAEFLLSEWMSKVTVGTQVCFGVCLLCVHMQCDNVEPELIKIFASQSTYFLITLGEMLHRKYSRFICIRYLNTLQGYILTK